MTLIQPKSTEVPITPPPELSTPTWNEQRAAALLAFEEEDTVTPAPPVAAEVQPTPISPRDQVIEPTLGKSPFAKLGLVATTCLGIFAIAGMIFSSLSKVPVQSPGGAQAADGTILLDTVLETGSTEKEKASLLTEAALGKQEAQLAALNPKRKANQQLTQPQSVPLPSKVPGQTISVPLPPMSLPPPPPIEAVPPAAGPSIDPTQQWLAASTTGSYGQVDLPAPPQDIPIPSAPELPAVNSAEEAAILNNQPVRQLLIGTQAPAKLMTPILHAAQPENAAQPASTWRFVVRLEAALSTTAGGVVLPAGTELAAEVTSLGASGLLNLHAVAAVVERREYKLPPQAISIRGAAGQPLIAQQYHDKGGEIAGMDAALVLFGGLAKVGELVNRPQSSASFTTGLGGISTSTQNPPANLTAAALEGGFTLLSQQVGDRNKQALQEALTRSNLWFVEQGTPVQVFVNQTIQL